MALHLPIGSLKTRSGLEPVSRCEPSTYQPTAPSGPVTTRSLRERDVDPWQSVRSWCDASSTQSHGGRIEIFLVPTSDPRLV